VSAVALLLCLLAAAYVGSALAAGRGIRGYGLPSGAEWLLLGVAVGPHGLGVFDSSTIREFQPFVIAGLGWVSLVIGIDYGYVGERRIGAGPLLLGCLLSFITFSAVLAAVWWVARRYPVLGISNVPAAALSLALVSCETTRHAVRWVVEHSGARGALSDRFADVGDADDAVPMLGFAVLIALVVKPDLTVDLSFSLRLGITAALGLGLGLVAAALLAKNLAFGESWTVLLGTALVGVGLSMRLGLGALTVLFLVGSVISLVSHRHSELRKLLAPTERPLMLPVLLLGGASLNLSHAIQPWVALIAVVLLVRISTKLGSGYLVSLAVPAPRRRPLATGAGLLASGTLAMSIGSYCFLQLEQTLGDLVLICAALTILIGELASPLGIRRALVRAGEIHEEERPVASRTPPTEEEERAS